MVRGTMHFADGNRIAWKQREACASPRSHLVIPTRICLAMLTSLLLVVAPGCKDFGDPVEPEEGPADAALFFNQNVLPIFQNHCGLAGCHRTVPPAAGLDLRDAQAFVSLVNVPSTLFAQNNLLLVASGEPDSSLLFLKVSEDNPPTGLRMPRVGALLSAAQIETIRNWIIIQP